MRLAALCADPGIPLDATKGASIHLVELWCALARNGVEIEGVAPWRGGPQPDAPPGLRLRPVRSAHGDGPPLDRRVRDVALAACRDARPDAVWERLALGSGAGLAVAMELGVPLVVEVNAPLTDEAAAHRGARIDASTLAIERATLAGASLVVCVSDALAPYVVAHGAEPGRVRVLPNGVHVASFSGAAAAGRRPAEDAAVRIGFAGSFKPWHGLEDLLVAFGRTVAEGVDARLELLGEGPCLPALRVRAAELGLGDRVTFLGARSHAEVAGWLASIDIAVAPGPGGMAYYFSPLKVYEYAAAGRAIVAAGAGQVRDRFRHGHDAWLVAPGDHDALARALITLARDPAQRLRLGAAARARAEREFDWDLTAGTLREWIETLGRRAVARGVGR